MSKFLYLCLFFSGALLAVSCDKEKTKPSHAIDRITVYDQNTGDVIGEYQYHYDSGKFTGFGEALNTEEKSGIKIKGVRLEREPNNDGGYNYTCWGSDQQVCYESS